MTDPTRRRSPASKWRLALNGAGSSLTRLAGGAIVLSAIWLNACERAAQAPGEDQRAATQTATGADSRIDPAFEAVQLEDKVGYIAQLLMVRGHLKAALALYDIGDADMAAMHMKHPTDELYATLEPSFAALGFGGFASDLAALAETAQADGSLDAVSRRFEIVDARIGEAIAAAQLDLRTGLLAVARLLAAAAEEYDEGVEDGVIVRLHEYQDAHGFIQTALAFLTVLEGPDAGAEDTLGAVREAVIAALATAPSVTPPAQITAGSGAITSAAARAQIAAFAL